MSAYSRLVSLYLNEFSILFVTDKICQENRIDIPIFFDYEAFYSDFRV